MKIGMIVGVLWWVSVARAAFEGPVPAAADAFGAAGPYTVATETLPSPRWTERAVTIYRPQGAPGKRPVWFFAHGFAGVNPAFYGELLTHLASHGAFVVFSPYPADLRPAENYPTMFAGFEAAVERLAEQADTTRVGFAGHSFGAGAVPSLALRGVRERGWGSNGLALLLLAPWYSFFVSDADLAAYPAGTQAVVQVYEDDTINDHRMAIDVFTRFGMPAADKDYLLVRSDRIEGYNYRADHNVPTGASNPRNGAFNAIDSHAVLRVAQALAASAWAGDPAGRRVALAGGAAEQVAMGVTPSGRTLRPMVQTDAPVPLYPQSRYLEKFGALLNPRRAASLPAATVRPRLSNLSVRGLAGTGADALIVGAGVTGERPDTLLVRAVGPGLGAFGVANQMPNPQLTLYRGAAVDLEIDDWGQTPVAETLEAVTKETAAFALAPESRDAAVLASFTPGTLTAVVPAAAGGEGEVLLELYEADEDDATRLTNLSARGRVSASGETGSEALLAGFAVSGGEMRVLVRGVGPALASMGLADTLADPVLEVFRSNVRISANDAWWVEAREEVAATAAAAGAFPLAEGSADAALVLTLPPGTYTAHLRARDGRGGIGLIEVYSVAAGAEERAR